MFVQHTIFWTVRFILLLLLRSELFFTDCWSWCLSIFFNHHVIRWWRWFRTFWHWQFSIWVDVLPNRWLLSQSFDLVYSNVVIQRSQRDHSWHADSKFIFLHDDFRTIAWFVKLDRGNTEIILNELKFRLKFSKFEVLIEIFECRGLKQSSWLVLIRTHNCLIY
jgi:hypothetical protein